MSQDPVTNSRLQVLFSALLLPSLLVGCSKKDSATPSAGPSSPHWAQAPGALQGLPFGYKPDSVATGLEFSITNKPSWATFNSVTGELSGVPDSDGNFENITISALYGGTQLTQNIFSLKVLGDPLAAQAWHLNNTGQTGFSTGAGIAGEDMKIAGALKLGYTGKGIRIGVSDTGLEIAHEDISGNILHGESRDYRLPFPFFGNPTSTLTRGDHGTSVSGLIAAVGWNGIGSRGVAPHAKIAGLNYLENQTDETELDQAAGDFDIVNQSWGIQQGDEPGDGAHRSYSHISPEYVLQLRHGVTRLRRSKGVIYVKSAGNSFVDDLRDGFSVSRNASGEGGNAYPYTILVGALAADGKKSSYSSAGSSIWISAAGGEFGDDSPAMITTDQSGCSVGYSRIESHKNPFEGGHLALNSQCNYTSTFNGTSSAAPVTSGIVALMLEANPELSWRDVKHILAVTATRVDAGITPLHHVLDPDGRVSEMPWTRNAVGHYFHNWYGFGRINAEAAVKMAKTYVSKLTKPLQTVSYELDPANLPIPDFDNDGATSEIEVPKDLRIEAIQIMVSATHPFTGDLGFELTSPSGTKSIVLNTNNAFNRPNLAQAVFLSNAFYQELSAGTWKLKVIDGRATNTGTLDKWEINVWGQDP